MTRRYKEDLHQLDQDSQKSERVNQGMIPLQLSRFRILFLRNGFADLLLLQRSFVPID